MFVRDILNLIVCSQRADWHIVRKIILGISFSTMMISSVLGMINLYQMYRQNFFDKHYAAAYFYQTIYADKEIKDMNYILNEFNISDDMVESTVMADVSPKSSDAFQAKNTVITVGENTYTAVNLFSGTGKKYQNIDYPNAEIKFGLVGKDSDWIPEMIFKGQGSDFILGRFPQSRGEIAVDDYFLKVYGINEDYESLLGKKITISQNDKSVNDYEITGIIDSTILQKREPEYSFESHYEHIYLYPKDENEIQITGGSIRYYFKDIARIADILENVSLDKIFEGYKGGFKYTEKLETFCVLYKLVNTVGIILMFIVFAIMLSAVVTVSYVMYFYWDITSKRINMFRCMGMTQKNIVCMTIAEQISIYGTGIFVGITLSIVMVESVKRIIFFAL